MTETTAHVHLWHHRHTPTTTCTKPVHVCARAEATAAAEQRLRALEGALRRLDHIARVYPQSLGEEAELDAALDESYRLLHPARALSAASGESASLRQGEPVGLDVALRLLRAEGRTTLKHTTECKSYGVGLGGGSRSGYECTCGLSVRQAVVDRALASTQASDSPEKP